MSRPTALVVGAGIAGLAAAIALRRAGYDVEVHERAPELRAVGAALSLWSNAMAGLRRLGAANAIEARAEPIARMLLATRSGSALIDRPVVDAFLPTRALLQAALLDGLGDTPLHLGRAAIRIVSAERGEVLFDDGETRSADLVIVADGIRSVLATALDGGAPTYRGYTGVVALSDAVDGRAGEGVAAEYWDRHERFGVLDVGGGRRYWFHMRNAPADAPAPGLDELVERARGWPAPVRDAVGATPPGRLIGWPIHAKRAPGRLARGRVVCMGDAGHAMEPNLGQGACQAIEDAVALGAAAGRAEAGAVPELFEAMRLARVRTTVRRSAEGGRAVHGSLPVRALMRAGLRLAPAGVRERMIAGLQTMPDY